MSLGLYRYRFYQHTHTMSRQTYSKLRNLLKASSISKGRYYSSKYTYSIYGKYYNIIARWETKSGFLETYTAKKSVSRRTSCPNESSLIRLFLEERNKKVWEF